jgi:uncharacterized protein YcbK (DUF882 family)
LIVLRTRRLADTQPLAGQLLAGKTLLRSICLGVVAFCALLGATNGTQDAVANGDTRTIEVMQMHTKERISVTFRRNGRYDQRGLDQLNWIMRDWRRDEATKMNPRLYDLLWEVHRSTGSREPVRVVSAYRAPQTNAALRRRSSAVAESSQHMSGNAVDFYLADVPADRIRAIGMRMQRGGVGYYPRANTPFIHLDVASVRHWPRMTRQQLVNMFPDQRTAHIPTDGKPLARFEEARREILAAGGMVMGETGNAVAQQSSGRRSLWAALFGGGEESEEDMAEANFIASEDSWVRPGSTPRAPAPAVVASAPPPAPIVAAAPVPAPVPVPAPQPVRAAVQATSPLPSGPPLAILPPRGLANVGSSNAIASAPALESPALLPPVRPQRAQPGQPGTQMAAAAPGLGNTAEQPAGPQLVWQQGPSGRPTNDTAQPEALQMLASLPMPPRRPDSLSSVSTSVTAYAGSTPAEPKDALAQLGIDPAVALRGGVAPEAAIGSRVSVLLPPRRQIIASVAAVEAAQPVAPLRQAAVQPPATTSIAPRPALRGAIAIARDESAALRSLFAANVTAAPAATPARIAVTRVRRDQPAPAGFVSVTDAGLAQGGFSKEPTSEMPTNAFVGPAVRPLQLKP